MSKITKNEKVIIGRGGYGEIYYMTKAPNVVYKKSIDSCKDFKKEYNNHEKIYKAYLNYTDVNKTVRKHYHVLRPYNYTKTKDNNVEKCIYNMARIKPLSGTSKVVWQSYIGEDNVNMDQVIKSDDGEAIRGRYMGSNTLKNKGLDVKSLARGAGILIAIIHYGAQLDGVDAELVIGVTGTIGSQDPGLYVIDFDKTSPWKVGNHGTVQRLGWSLEAEPYYPYSNNPLHPYFIKGYYEVAKHYGYLDLAQKVIKYALSYVF